MKKAALLLLACTMLSGCASRHKEVHEAKSTYKFTNEVDSSFSFNSLVKSGTESTRMDQSDSTNWIIEYDGAPEDSFSITETGSDGKTTTTTFHGKGKANITKGQQSSSSSAIEKSASEEQTQIEASSAQQVTEVAETRTKDKEVQSTGFQGLWIVLIILIIVGRWLWNRKKNII